VANAAPSKAFEIIIVNDVKPPINKRIPKLKHIISLTTKFSGTK
jgi:hypothetical protein